MLLIAFVSFSDKGALYSQYILIRALSISSSLSIPTSENKRSMTKVKSATSPVSWPPTKNINIERTNRRNFLQLTPFSVLTFCSTFILINSNLSWTDKVLYNKKSLIS